MKKIYENGLPSVTQILGVVRKLGLEAWFKMHGREADKLSAQAKEVGTTLHELIDKLGKGQEAKITTTNPEVINVCEAFKKFKEENSIKIQETEIAVEGEKYNGTIDCVGKFNKKLTLLDWKTCNDKFTLYPEYVAQISAYKNLLDFTQKYRELSCAVIMFSKVSKEYKIYEISMPQLIIGKEFFDAAYSLFLAQKKLKDTIKENKE